MTKRLLFILFSLFLVKTAFSQTVSGIVKDAETGELLPFVSVLERGTTNGAQTDLDGKFTIRAANSATLVFSFTGFQTEEIAVAGRSFMEILLRENAGTLDEVVVVGYGTQRKSQLTGAIASIGEKDFEGREVSSIGAAVQGKVSGLQVYQPSGTPGAGLLISIRGNKNPLYVVDGVPLVDEAQSALATAFDLEGNVTGAGQSTSSISDINFDDIERVEVLKDASATAIYGARAANGVVLITTKRGKAGKTQTNFEVTKGFSQLSRRIDFLSSAQMVDLLKTARANDLALYQTSPLLFGDDFDAATLSEPLQNFELTGQNTDWIDAVTRTAPQSSYEFSMRGGDERTRFFMSSSLFDQQGIVIESFYKRFNYRLNLDHKINSRLTFGTNLLFSKNKTRRQFNDDTYTGIITNALGASPLMPAYENDGSYADYTNYQASWLSDNPVLSANEIRAFSNGNRLLTTAFGEYVLSKRWKFRSSVSSDLAFLNDDQFKSPITADASAVGGEKFEANFNQFTWLNENVLSYNKDSEKNAFGLTFALTEQETRARQSTATGQGFPSGGLENISSAATITRATSLGSSFAIISGIGRINYGFLNKYLFSATVRADASSRFSKSNRVGYFPSAAFAWRVSDEFFAKKAHNHCLSDLKIRVSYGLTGDQEIGDFQNITFYRPASYAGLSGLQIRNLADPNLTWQTNRQFNAGIDFDLFNGKVAGSFEAFSATKTDVLSEDIIPGTSGFATLTRNSGEVENRGVELNLNTFLIKNARFSWDLGLNFTNVRNRITRLSSDGVLLSAFNDLTNTHILKVGQPVGTFWGINFLGIDPATGDPMFEDSDGDGDVDLDDSKIIGRALPPYFGGITNNFKAGKWDATIFCNFVWGNETYNLIRSTYENMGYGNGDGVYSIYANNSTNVLDYWKKPGDQTEYAQPSAFFEQYIQNSSQFIENGAFLRVSNVQIGYNLKPKKTFRTVRFSLSAENLFVFTAYKGFDPEVSSNGGTVDRTAGVDYGAYPKARTILFGVNVGF